MKRFKKVVDERQELELLRIEHVVFWIMFWGLFISFIVQSMFMDVPFRQYLPEFVIFMVSCVGVIIGSVKKGQWDFYTRPTMKTYVLTSLIGSVAFGIIFGIAQYVRTEFYEDKILVLVLTTVIMMAVIFAAIFALSALVGHMVKKKQERLADAYGDDEDE